MSDSTLVRPERSISGYSRGAELTRAIHAMWQANEATPISVERVSIVNQRIESLMAEFDLTYGEWYYWSRLCAERES
jgi:hypothetical protein